MKDEAEVKWGECLELIRKWLYNDTAFNTWFAPTVAKSLRGNHLTLVLPSMFCRELYEGEYADIFSAALRTVFGKMPHLTYLVPVVSNTKGGSVKIESPVRNKPSASEQTSHPIRNIENAAVSPKNKRTRERDNNNEADKYIPQLNASLSFENYCVGSSNKLPWSIAESISRQPVNSTFNPFFLYGDVGVGKTHLMQAIGLEVLKNFPEKRVVFLPMKEFQRLYQNAYLQKEIPAFLQWFMRCDVLLFDDLQEIISSEGTLNNALFPIFNHMHQHGKQLVFTCDRPPQDLRGLEARLIDRFKWGITEKLEKPDAALRKKILTFKARKNGLDLPADVIEYVASAPLNSVREIEGVVLGIITRAISLGQEIDLSLAKEVLSRSIVSSDRKSVNFDMIVETTAEKFRLNSDVLFSKSRVKDVADARMTIMYLANKVLGLSSGAIGRKLGRKHSTIIHGINTVKKRLEEDDDFKLLVNEIEEEL